MKKTYLKTMGGVVVSLFLLSTHDGYGAMGEMDKFAQKNKSINGSSLPSLPQGSEIVRIRNSFFQYNHNTPPQTPIPLRHETHQLLEAIDRAFGRVPPRPVPPADDSVEKP